MKALGVATYRGITALLEPLAGTALALAARREDRSLREERLGRGVVAPADTWWHAASLGEVAALEPVLTRATVRGLAGSFRVTTSTTSGRDLARRTWEGRAGLAPLDLPRAVGTFLRHLEPRVLILTETELWPNWLLAAHRRGVRVAIVNARLSDRSWARYRRIAGFMRPLLAPLVAVAAREPRDAERFRRLGVAPEALQVTGNTKHDRTAVAPPAELPWKGDPVWVVGSLRPGEEGAILDAFERVRVRWPVRLVLAPRHPQEWPEVEALLAGRGLAMARRSRPRPQDAEAPVLWADRLGELASLYAAARVAFVGGTLVPLGGHNILEAAAAGVPVLFGPHTANVAKEAETLIGEGGGRRVTGARDLGPALDAWFGDPDVRDAASAGARRAVDSLRGASDRALEWLVARGVWGGADGVG